MGMQVNAAWRDDQPSGIENLLGIAIFEATNFGDLAVFDTNVGLLAWHTGPIDNPAIANNRIELSHDLSSIPD